MNMLIFLRRTFRSIHKLVSMATFFLPSFLRVPLLRMAGFKIGKNVTICPLSIIVADEVEIGNDVYISPLALVFNLKKLKLGHGAYIGLGALIHGHGAGGLEMGDFASAGMFTIINCSCDVTTGKYARIGPRAMVWSHGNALPKNQGFTNRYGPIKLGDYVWVMMGAKITARVTIGDYVTIHPGTVVMVDIPSHSVYRHNIETFRIQPMTSLHLKTVDDAFIDKWKTTMFSDFPSFVQSYFDQSIECVSESDGWSVKISDEVVKIWDGDKMQGMAPPLFGKHDIVLMITGANEKARLQYSRLNWLDAKSNHYNKPHPHALFEYVSFYFHMQYGIFFSIYDG